MSGAVSSAALGRILGALYFASGAASLAYEVLWARMLSVQFGVSIFGVVVTVGAFMVGLGIGSVLGVRVGAGVRQPLRAFAVLELAVALFALSVPWVFQTVGAILSGWSADAALTSWHALQLGAAFFLMAIPALAMGAGFPLLLRAAAGTPATLGRVYGLNALGGMAGALLPLWLLPALGWLATTQVFAVLGIIIAATAYGLARTRPAVATADIAAPSLPPWSVTLLYAGIGAAALMLEIGWTRLYGMIMLRTEYVLAVIVAVFLAGIGAGSLIARRMTQPVWLIALPVIAALGAVGTLWLLPLSARWIESATYPSLFTAMVAQGALLALITFPVTLALGAWLPLLTARYGGNTQHGAWLYGANSIGAALGTLLTGFVFVPVIGTPATLASATLLLLACGLALAGARKAWLMLLPVAALAMPVAQLPAVATLLPRAQSNARDLFVYEDAVSITHVVEHGDGQRLLLDDLQRMDASSEPEAVVSQRNQARLPLLLHAQPKSVLLLGLGTGISASGALPYPALAITAVELSRGAIAATADWFAPVNGDIARSIDIVRDDARRYLARSAIHYDVIIGDLFHPDLAGRSALLSVEQFTRARERLNDGGVFAQWIALNQFDGASLDIVLRSFQRAFPAGVLFVDPFRIALVGTRGARVSAVRVQENMARLDAAARAAATGGEGEWTWLGRYLGPVATLVSSDGPVQHEASPRIEYLLPKARYRGELDVAALLQSLLKKRPPWQQAAEQLDVRDPDRAAFEPSYVATELALAGWIAALRDNATEGARLQQLAYQANPRDRWTGYALANNVWNQYDAMVKKGDNVRIIFGRDERDVLEAILRLHPEHVPALKALRAVEQWAGNAERAQQIGARIKQIAPLERGD